MIIFEHQSTINENMPLRILLYIARIYEKITEEEALYQKALIQLPRPRFIVLYGYAAFIEKIRENRETMAIKEAVDKAVRDCSEVYNMLFTVGRKKCLLP